MLCFTSGSFVRTGVVVEVRNTEVKSGDGNSNYECLVPQNIGGSTGLASGGRGISEPDSCIERDWDRGYPLRGNE